MPKTTKCCDKCDAQQIPPVLGGSNCWDSNCECHQLKEDWEEKWEKFLPTVLGIGQGIMGDVRPFIREQIAKAVQVERQLWLDADKIDQKFIKETISRTRAKENQAWLNHERCHSCGNEMKPQPLTDTCGKCLENN
jgi:hypothetical protein